MQRLTKIGFGNAQPSRSNRRGEWVVVERVLDYGDETGDTVEVFIGSHRQCIDYREFHDVYSNLELARVA